MGLQEEVEQLFIVTGLCEASGSSLESICSDDDRGEDRNEIKVWFVRLDEIFCCLEG